MPPTGGDSRGPRRPRPRRLAMQLLTGLTVVVAVASTWLVVARPMNSDQPPGLRYLVVSTVLPSALLVAAGLIFWLRRPDNVLGPLLVVDAMSQYGWALVFAPSPVLVTAALLLANMHAAIAVHVTLAWPSGRLLHRADRAVVVLAYGYTLLGSAVTAPLDGVAGNLLRMRSWDPFFQPIALVALVPILPLFLGWMVRIVLRWRQAQGISRAFLRPILLSAPVFALIYLVGFPLWYAQLLPGLGAVFVNEVFYLVAYGALPVGFLVGALRLRVARTAVMTSLVEAGELPAPDVLESVLRRRLDDPRLQVFRYSPARAAFVDRDGRVQSLPQDDSQVATTVLEREGQPLAAVVHDAALLHDPGLVAAVTGAVRLALGTAALRDELHARGGQVEELPEGDVTFLFGDVQGSTELLEQLPDRYADLLAELRALVNDAVRAEGGRLVDARGDEIFAAFGDPAAGVRAATSIQRRLIEASWPENVRVRLRTGLHRGRPRRTASGYVGRDVHIAARVMAAAHGGQILVSEPLITVVRACRDLDALCLGAFVLAGLREPVVLAQVLAPGLPEAFPAPRAQPAPTNRPDAAVPG